MADERAVVVNSPGNEKSEYAEDRGAIYQGLFGQSGILDIAEKLDCTKFSNNEVRMASGDYLNQGYQIRIPYGDVKSFQIDTGTVGQKRHDLIVAEFERVSQLEDSHIFKVIKGTSSATTPQDPELIQQDLNAGGTFRQEALYRVVLDGVEIIAIERIANDIINSTATRNDNLLINGAFSLWDRGTTWNSPSSGTYTANRWRSSSVVCKKVSPISNGGIRVEGAPQHHNMAQLVEWQHFELNETERVTLSVMLKFDNPGVEFLIGRGGRQGTPEDPTGVYKSFISTGELQKVSFTFDAVPITGNDAKPWWISPVRIGAVTTPQSYEIYSAKLELGEIATPHFPRSRSVERTMASRYCAPMFGGYGWVSAAGRADIMYPIQSAFRVKPTVILPSGESVRVRGYNGVVGQSSNVTVSNSYTTQILVAINGIATNVPVGTAFAYMTAGTLILDAEIY